MYTQSKHYPTYTHEEKAFFSERNKKKQDWNVLFGVFSMETIFCYCWWWRKKKEKQPQTKERVIETIVNGFALHVVEMKSRFWRKSSVANIVFWFVWVCVQVKSSFSLCLFQSPFHGAHSIFIVFTIFRVFTHLLRERKKVYNDQRYYVVFRMLLKWVTINVFLSLCCSYSLSSFQAAFMVDVGCFFCLLKKKTFCPFFQPLLHIAYWSLIISSLLAYINGANRKKKPYSYLKV